jgi:hypothetical protein
MQVGPLPMGAQVAVESINPGNCFCSGNRLWVRVEGEGDHLIGERPRGQTVTQSAPRPGVNAVDMGNGEVAQFPFGFPVLPVTAAISLAPAEEATQLRAVGGR